MSRVLKMVFKFTLFLMVLFTAAFVTLWLQNRGDYPVAKTVDSDPALPVIEANGYRFHGEAFGDPAKPVVIVVHGGPGWDYRSMLPLKSLEDDYFVVFYDQRGTGLSPRVDASQLTLQSSLEDLDAIVDKHRGEGRVSLVGHSWGAMLVTAYLGREPHKVSHAVLAEPGFLTTEMFERSGVHMGPRWEPGYLWFATQKWFESLQIPDEEAAMDYFLGEVAPAANPEYYCNGVMPEVGKLRWRAGATAMTSVVSSARNKDGQLDMDLTKGLLGFTRPILLLASECNSLIGVEYQKHHQRYFRDSQLKIIRNSGHMMISEQPEETLQIIRSYLAEPH